jgi:hypothetical protein
MPFTVLVNYMNELVAWSRIHWSSGLYLGGGADLYANAAAAIAAFAI